MQIVSAVAQSIERSPFVYDEPRIEIARYAWLAFTLTH